MPSCQDQWSQMSDIHTCAWVNDDLDKDDRELLNVMTQKCTEFAKAEEIVDHGCRDAARAKTTGAYETRDEFERFLNKKLGDSCKGCHPEHNVRHVIDRAKFTDCNSSELLPESKEGQQGRFRRFLGTCRGERRGLGRWGLSAHSVRRHVRPVILQVNTKSASKESRNADKQYQDWSRGADTRCTKQWKRHNGIGIGIEDDLSDVNSVLRLVRQDLFCT
jgi:hypothetical protein